MPKYGKNNKIRSDFPVRAVSFKESILRVPLIPGITDTKENLDAIANIAEGHPVEHLPYNKMAGAKYKMLGMDFELDENHAG